MLGSSKDWVHVPHESDTDKLFDEGPDEAVEHWHKKRKLFSE